MTRAAQVLLCGLVLSSAKKPNIVMIVSDDLGFNDVSFHGSPQVPTPHIDAIAAEGVTLMDYHVQPVCSPTRATIMSGRHVIHTGIYMPFQQGTALRLHLNYTLLPAYLKQLGYRTHMVGKWHLGQNVLAALPTGRGFDSYFGYWSGAEDYFTHDCRGAYDLADGVRTAFEFNNSYSTFLWTQKAVEVVEQSDAAEPFFLYLAYQNIHWPLEAPQSYIDRFANRTAGNAGRQSILAMVSVMDEGVGNLTAALKAKGIYDDTLLIFSTDNGGPTNGNEGTWSNNYPMRGGKNTIWEGGTRGVGSDDDIETQSETMTPREPTPPPQQESSITLSDHLDDDDEEEQEMEIKIYHHKDGTFYLTDVGGGQFDENWVISEEQGEDEECHPSEFIKLGTWTGDINDNPTVTRR